MICVGRLVVGVESVLAVVGVVSRLVADLTGNGAGSLAWFVWWLIVAWVIDGSAG